MASVITTINIVPKFQKKIPLYACPSSLILFDTSGRLGKTTMMSSHHMAEYRPTGSETLPPYAPRSSRYGSVPLSVEAAVDVW